MKKLQISCFALILILFSCEQRNIENTTTEQVPQLPALVDKSDAMPSDPISRRIYLMQSKIDSAAALYDSAITEFNNGLNEKEIRAKYQERIRALQGDFAKSYEEATQLYMDEEISESDYELITLGLMLDDVQAKSDSLERSGIFFLE
ncbi:MAG: hypothetical protein ACK4ND_02715 [Cytophagaceae bacterium]